MPPSWSGLFTSKKDNGSDGSISPTPNSKREKRKEKQSTSGHGMGYLRGYADNDDPRLAYHHRGDPRSNGRFIDPRGMGFSAREDPDIIRSRLMGQFQSSLNSVVTDSIRKACLHWDDEVLHLENNYHNVLEERNGLKTENKNLANKVKALEAEVNAKVALLREFQSGHLKTAGSKKLAPSSSAISTEYEGLERRIKDTVFARLARLNIKDPYIHTLLHHQPFLEAVKSIMVDAKEAEDAENVPLNLLEVVEESEKKGLLMWIIQGVIHDVLHRKVMDIHMPGLNLNELQVMEKIFNVIALSEEGQGMKSAQEWRADTYRRLAYWAENVEELGNHIKTSPVINEISQIFAAVIDGAETDIKRILQPLCDESPEGKNFSRLIVDIVDRAFQFSILIGSQTARYELHRDLDHTDDFKAVPDHLEENASAANNSNVSLFYAVPALVKGSSEDGEAYDVSELLVSGKIYVLFGFGDLIEEEERLPDVPEKLPIQLASPVNGGDLEHENLDAITPIRPNVPPAVPRELDVERHLDTPSETTPEPKSLAVDPSTNPSGADTLPNESNPSMTEFSEIIPEQELIVISTIKDMTESSDQAPKNEPSGATAMTTSNSSEKDTPKETLDTSKQQGQAAEEAPHQEPSTKTGQVIADPKSPEPLPQATQQTPKELLEVLPNSGHLPSPEKKFQSPEAHLTETPASLSLPRPPSIPNQAAPPQQGVPAAIPELQCPVLAPVGTEPAPLPIQTQPPVSHTASVAAELEGIPRPQVPLEAQEESSPEPSTSSTSQNQELASQNELEQQQQQQHHLSSQLTNNNSESSNNESSNSEISLMHSTPRTLPPGPIKLNVSSDSSKIQVTMQEEKGTSVETVV
ncbi:hypothetical protein TWF718_010158 [Orbilia javanica]|uniref:Uncharacterized protein n=1 Tax=Orbilia javanica TaxID=47235 RepID=A0AAN8MTX3_9PEZI